MELCSVVMCSQMTQSAYNCCGTPTLQVILYLSRRLSAPKLIYLTTRGKPSQVNGTLFLNIAPVRMQ